MVWRGDAPLGLLDYQDAVAAHPAYDLVSALQDARRDVDPATEQAQITRYLAATGLAEAPVSRGLCPDRCTAGAAHPGCLCPAGDPGRQAALSGLHAAGLGASAARPGASGAGASAGHVG
ncbi:phosphotransferase [Paracoccus sp. NBH48]|uniref:phosphotransferase n=1 Tax=Paracoccus sp. NBH48 TaxID=2596918 RepID=UPI00351C7E7A